MYSGAVTEWRRPRCLFRGSNELVWEGGALSTEIRIQLVCFWMLCSRSSRVWETKSARAHPHMPYGKIGLHLRSSYPTIFFNMPISMIRTLMAGGGMKRENID